MFSSFVELVEQVSQLYQLNLTLSKHLKKKKTCFNGSARLVIEKTCVCFIVCQANVLLA